MSEQTLSLPREGEKIGAGIVLNLISAGGSARVYKTWAADLELHRAVKVMNPDATPEIRDRFRTEARITSKLLHANIVHVHNFGETASGLPYIEMELITGQTLESVLQQRGALPLPVALAVITGVLEALNYAHTLKYTLYEQPQTGVMHRDIKPGNVIFSGGIPKLMDFGIARPVTVSLHTIPGAVPGTVPYMSPETCTGGESDFRSDIYQIGLLLYECISGVMAFPQSEISPLIDAIKAGEYKLLDTHPKAAAIAKRCMAIDPANRYQTAQECLADVRALYHAQNPRVTPEEQIAAYLQDTTPTPAKVKTPISSKPAAAKKGLVIAAITVPCVLLTIILICTGIYFAPAMLRALAALAPATEEPKAEDAPIMDAPAESTTTPAAPRPKPAAAATPKPAPARAAATPAAPPPESSPEDAAFYIKQGERLLAENKPQEALASYQKALETPSTTPRQVIGRQALYGLAKANTALYERNKTPRGNYEAAWRSVQGMYPAGSPEHTEATNHLKGTIP